MKVGIDIVEIERFEKIAKNLDNVNNIFTPEEIAYFKTFSSPVQHIAGTFAAKEAVAKAFKTGFNSLVTPQNIEILHLNQVPQVNLLGQSKDYFKEKGFKEIDISISHNKTNAIAICIIN